MFAFKTKEKGINVERDARQCMAAVQMILVQQLCSDAKKQGKNQEEVGVLALVHGIALLFLKLEREEKNRRINSETLLEMKQQIILTNMEYAFGKDISEAKVEQFSRLIYEVLARTDCSGENAEEEAVTRIADSLDDTIQLGDREYVLGLVSTLQKYVNKDLNKKMGMPK